MSIEHLQYDSHKCHGYDGLPEAKEQMNARYSNNNQLNHNSFIISHIVVIQIHRIFRLHGDFE
jgi:hypothetical protein